MDKRVMNMDGCHVGFRVDEGRPFLCFRSNFITAIHLAMGKVEGHAAVKQSVGLAQGHPGVDSHGKTPPWLEIGAFRVEELLVQFFAKSRWPFLFQQFQYLIERQSVGADKMAFPQVQACEGKLEGCVPWSVEKSAKLSVPQWKTILPHGGAVCEGKRVHRRTRNA